MSVHHIVDLVPLEVKKVGQVTREVERQTVVTVCWESNSGPQGPARALECRAIYLSRPTIHCFKAAPPLNVTSESSPCVPSECLIIL